MTISFTLHIVDTLPFVAVQRFLEVDEEQVERRSNQNHNHARSMQCIKPVIHIQFPYQLRLESVFDRWPQLGWNTVDLSVLTTVGDRMKN